MVPELSHRKADNLYGRLMETNKHHKVVHRLPSEEQVATWIAEAKKLPKVIEY